ncbi:MAG: DnaJ domain-containing protein [Defluviitaleaceae bacterium]|nr:DnaJ domain-containing protein [Defluviitaleaceae bacterium]
METWTNNCWDVLGIAPTTDKRAIKKAYAKLLTQYHPEEHPEQFEEINRAYNNALQYGVWDVHAFENPQTFTQPSIDTSDELFNNTEHSEPEQPETQHTHQDIPPTHQQPVYSNSVFKDDAISEAEEIRWAEEQNITYILDGLRSLLDSKTSRTYTIEQCYNDISKYITDYAWIYNNNPYFIRSLATLLKDKPISNNNIDVIRKVIFIKKFRKPDSKTSDLNNALYHLNVLLKAKRRKNAASNITVGWLIAIAVILFVTYSAMLDSAPQSTPTQPPIPPATQSQPTQIPIHIPSNDNNPLTIMTPELQNQFGLMYLRGEGVTQNYETALFWFRRAAENGVTDAKFNLGHMYECGHGIDQDHDMAIYWYTKAIEGGNVWAEGALERLLSQDILDYEGGDTIEP